jgi:hypothetical protein
MLSAWVVILATLAFGIDAQMDCSKAPTAALRTVCQQINNWDKNARAAPQPNKQGIVLPPGIDPKDIGAANFEIPQVAVSLLCNHNCLCIFKATAEQCMTLGKLFDFMAK